MQWMQVRFRKVVLWYLWCPQECGVASYASISAWINRSYDRSHSTSEQQIGVFSLTDGLQGPRQGE